MRDFIIELLLKTIGVIITLLILPCIVVIILSFVLIISIVIVIGKLLYAPIKLIYILKNWIKKI